MKTQFRGSSRGSGFKRGFNSRGGSRGSRGGFKNRRGDSFKKEVSDLNSNSA